VAHELQNVLEGTTRSEGPRGMSNTFTFSARPVVAGRDRFIER